MLSSSAHAHNYDINNRQGSSTAMDRHVDQQLSSLRVQLVSAADQRAGYVLQRVLVLYCNLSLAIVCQREGRSFEGKGPGPTGYLFRTCPFAKGNKA